METFEIHITGDESIIEVSKTLDLKTIEVWLLHPNKSRFRKECMTSIVKKFENYDSCKEWVDGLELQLRHKGVSIFRVKIESPYYNHYEAQSCYIESHFDASSSLFPISQNARKTTFLATDRRYCHDLYQDFLNQYKNTVVELCLYDSDVEEDRDWFNLYR